MSEQSDLPEPLDYQNEPEWKIIRIIFVFGFQMRYQVFISDRTQQIYG